jgi:hypothetical protein
MIYLRHREERLKERGRGEWEPNKTTSKNLVSSNLFSH